MKPADHRHDDDFEYSVLRTNGNSTKGDVIAVRVDPRQGSNVYHPDMTHGEFMAIKNAGKHPEVGRRGPPR